MASTPSLSFSGYWFSRTGSPHFLEKKKPAKLGWKRNTDEEDELGRKLSNTSLKVYGH